MTNTRDRNAEINRFLVQQLQTLETEYARVLELVVRRDSTIRALIQNREELIAYIALLVHEQPRQPEPVQTLTDRLWATAHVEGVH